MIESNSHKRPQGWKLPNNNEVGGTFLEYILMTGEDQENEDNNNQDVCNTTQWHNKFNMVDPDDGDDRGTCDHCGAYDQPVNFCYACKKG